MEYRIEYANGQCCNYANGRKDLIEWIKLLKDETITDVRKLYKSGASDSVMDIYKKYIMKGDKGNAVPKDTTMLKPDSQKVLIAMAEAEMEPKELAAKSGVPVNIVYTMRRGFYAKPKYIGAVSKVLNVKVADLIEDKENVSGQAAAT